MVNKLQDYLIRNQFVMPLPKPRAPVQVSTSKIGKFIAKLLMCWKKYINDAWKDIDISGQETSWGRTNKYEYPK